MTDLSTTILSLPFGFFGDFAQAGNCDSCWNRKEQKKNKAKKQHLKIENDSQENFSFQMQCDGKNVTEGPLKALARTTIEDPYSEHKDCKLTISLLDKTKPTICEIRESWTLREERLTFGKNGDNVLLFSVVGEQSGSLTIFNCQDSVNFINSGEHSKLAIVVGKGPAAKVLHPGEQHEIPLSQLISKGKMKGIMMHLHSHGPYDCEIKPEGLIMKKEGEVKLSKPKQEFKFDVSPGADKYEVVITCNPFVNFVNNSNLSIAMTAAGQEKTEKVELHPGWHKQIYLSQLNAEIVMQLSKPKLEKNKFVADYYAYECKIKLEGLTTVHGGAKFGVEGKSFRFDANTTDKVDKYEVAITCIHYWKPALDEIAENISEVSDKEAEQVETRKY